MGTEAGVKKAKAILDKKVAELASIEEKEVVVVPDLPVVEYSAAGPEVEVKELVVVVYLPAVDDSVAGFVAEEN